MTAWRDVWSQVLYIFEEASLLDGWFSGDFGLRSPLGMRWSVSEMDSTLIFLELWIPFILLSLIKLQYTPLAHFYPLKWKHPSLNCHLRSQCATNLKFGFTQDQHHHSHLASPPGWSDGLLIGLAARLSHHRYKTTQVLSEMRRTRRLGSFRIITSRKVCFGEKIRSDYVYIEMW